MEQIIQFDSTIIKAKNGQDYIKILLITMDKDDNTSVYTSFMKFENGVEAMMTTPGYLDNLDIIDITYVGKVGYDSRYAAVLRYMNVDGVPAICNIIFSKNY